MRIPTPCRPIVMILAACAVCAPLAGAQQPSHASPTVGRTIEPRAMAVLAKVERTMIGLKTYQAECYTTGSYYDWNRQPVHERSEFARLLAAKPNKMHYEFWELDLDAKTGRWLQETNSFRTIFVCDGRTFWKQFGPDQFGPAYYTFNRMKPDDMHPFLEPWGGFYTASSSPHSDFENVRKRGELLELRRTGSEKVNGVLCDKIFAQIDEGNDQGYRETWYVSHDGLVRREVKQFELNGMPGGLDDAVIRNIRLNQPIVASIFTYKPPQGAHGKEVKRRPTPPV
ncbi:MAG: hypothetical protein M3Y56_10520 [Armatimonadota bacterium]|nr:hypothetical protein [Armatimonadota bacterium]